MQAAHLTRRALADKLGVHSNTVSGWISGKYQGPRDPAQRQRLAEVLGEDVFATWVDYGDGRDVVRLEDIPQDVFADEVLRRMGVTRSHSPFVINDSESIRYGESGQDDQQDDGPPHGAQA